MDNEKEYVLDRLGRIVGFRREGIPEGVRRISIKGSGPWEISVVTLEGKTFTIKTSGSNTIGEIVDRICELVR